MLELDSDIKEKMLALKKALAEGADGKVLKRELSKELRGLMNPLVTKQRAAVLRLPSKGGSRTNGGGMRQAVARQTKAATRWSGQNAGVSIIQRARGMPRDFRMAGRMFNREEGWNPKTLGGEQVHQEMSPSQWFDRETVGVRPDVARDIDSALERTAAKLAQKAR